MTMKLRIGFTITAETLFGMMAKVLPIEDLHIEEMPEHPPQQPRVKAVDAPKIKRRGRSRRANIEGGQLKVLLDHIRTRGVSGYSELGDALKASGFSKSGVGSALNRAVTKDILVKRGNGYDLSDRLKEAA